MTKPIIPWLHVYMIESYAPIGTTVVMSGHWGLPPLRAKIYHMINLVASEAYLWFDTDWAIVSYFPQLKQTIYRFLFWQPLELSSIIYFPASIALTSSLSCYLIFWARFWPWAWFYQLGCCFDLDLLSLKPTSPRSLPLKSIETSRR